MLKKLFSIILLSTVLFLSCKKDTQINPPVAKPVEVTPPTPFVLQDVVYPNPCHGTFTIGTNTTDSQTVVMSNVVGQQIFSLIINGTTAIVDNSLTNGVYFIHISSKYGNTTKKIIVN